MKFYVVRREEGDNAVCYKSKRLAVEAGRDIFGGDSFEIAVVDIEINSDTIAYMLSESGVDCIMMNNLIDTITIDAAEDVEF